MTNNEAALAYKRIFPNIELKLKTFRESDKKRWDDFSQRLTEEWEQLYLLLRNLYDNRVDLYYHIEETVLVIAHAYSERDENLITMDKKRYYNPNWFQENTIVGGALYVNLFSENLKELKKRISYFKELGITYLHLMPMFAVKPGDNDGGYAVSSYRSLNPEIGTIEDLKELSKALHDEGIVLVLDFIFNHTADDHYWAQMAKSSHDEFMDYYYMFREKSDTYPYEEHLREIFPTVRKGNFTWDEESERWVWTTFNSFQWDLKYKNPQVFTSMLGEMLFILNQGVDILRLDAVAFIWKELGTNCENLPGAHTIIQIFNTCIKIFAPGILFKSEAIVHPDQVLEYISERECQLSYNPLFMSLIWESLATRDVSLLVKSISKRHKLPTGCSWCNYLRCHDDIGWTFADSDAWELGINPQGHRKFLNDFYTGQFEGSFARGIPFQPNLETGDMRISGTLASLAGLEEAVNSSNELKKEMAIRRIELLNSVILSYGGIPLLYLGEEWGVLNDYNFVNDPSKKDDSRWIHRPKINWEYLADINDNTSIHHTIFNSIKSLISKRKELKALTGNSVDIVNLENKRLFAYIRSYQGYRLFVICNFSDSEVSINENIIRTTGLSRCFRDLISGKLIHTDNELIISPYQYLWLERE